jgi:hypothetical protein
MTDITISLRDCAPVSPGGNPERSTQPDSRPDMRLRGFPASSPVRYAAWEIQAGNSDKR